MRMFKITVNGKGYDVAVEEIAALQATKSPTIAAVPAAPVAPKATPAPEAPSKPAPEQKVVSKPPASAEGKVVVAPMPGTILTVSVKEGAQVKSGEVLLILEAMKMENEITSPVAGTVKKVAVNKGGNVNTGDVLVVIE
ncbi:MAG: biotin/lipoyl-binding protein [Firmicutes bacterium]|nr:biotin/lipoyl-binding protein [Bacillota bacterium]